MKYQAVIFDLDGTLLNTLEDLTDAVNAALVTKGLPCRTIEEVRQFVGNGIVKLMERAVPGGKEHPDFPELMDAFRKYYGEHCEDKTTPYDGILALLDALKDKKMKMAVVSNKADFAVQTLIPRYFGDRISYAFGENEEAGIHKKPSPDMVNQALQKLGVSREDAVYVGDSDVDLQTAKNSQMDCVGVSWGFRGRKFLEENGATYIIDKPQQLLELLEND